MLMPLFGVLQGMIADGMPLVEVRVVPRDVTVEVMVERIVERIVDRLVFVPVPTVTLHPWTRSCVGSVPMEPVAAAPGRDGVGAGVPSLVRAGIGLRPPDAAVAAGIAVPGAPIIGFGPVPGAVGGPNPVAANAPLVSSGDVQPA